MRKIIIILILLIYQPAVAKNFDLEKFITTHELSLFDLKKIPQSYSSSNRYYVELKSGKLSLSNEERNTNQTTFKVGNVEYIGFSAGEFGGNLEVVVDGKKPRELMKGNIVHLQPMGEKLFIIEGLAHLSLANGSISVIDDIKNPTTPRLVAKLPDAPRLVYLDKTRSDYQRLIIVGTQSVISLNPYEDLEVLSWDAFWQHTLKPSSIVRHGEHYFIGLSHGVATVPVMGESSRYCRKLVNGFEYSCLKIQFYAEREYFKLLDQ